jgi:hypothetical protein
MGKELLFSKILSFLLLVLNGYCSGFFLPLFPPPPRHGTIDLFPQNKQQAIKKYFSNGRQIKKRERKKELPNKNKSYLQHCSSYSNGRK